MKNYVCVLLSILCSVFEMSKSQYIMMNNKVNKSNQCDPNNSLVEQFFNLIFTEFQHRPPVCVCVQMCIERPTYCYPNGCLRRPDRIKQEDTTTTAHPVNQIQYNSHSPEKSVMFLVDSDKDLIDNIFEDPRINSYSERRDKPSSQELIFHPYPFKELVFKYRKLPKLEMRYNLREKVKNTQKEKVKRDKLDVSKTRWPINKHLLQSKQLFNSIRHYKKDDDLKQTLFLSMFPELETNNKASLNKKFLTKRDDRQVNIDALYVYKTDNANFSIENLIDDLIINSLDDKNNNYHTNSTQNIYVDKSNVTTTLNTSDGNGIQKNNFTTNKNQINTTLNIISNNLINENINIDKCTRDTNSTKNNKTYSDDIITMIEKIEKNNNLSIELAKRVTGLRNLDNETSFSNADNIKNNIDPILGFTHETNFQSINSTTESNKINVEVTPGIKKWTASVLKANKHFTIKQKSKQRIVRKLNRKLN